jgi:hypothetical protein
VSLTPRLIDLPPWQMLIAVYPNSYLTRGEWPAGYDHRLAAIPLNTADTTSTHEDDGGCFDSDMMAVHVRDLE